MALRPKLIGPAISSITGLITSTGISFIGLALNFRFQRFCSSLAAGRGNELRPGLADVVDRHPAHPELHHAAGRIVDALTSARRLERKLGASRAISPSFERNPRSAI
jgi:hypothetical protein